MLIKINLKIKTLTYYYIQHLFRLREYLNQHSKVKHIFKTTFTTAVRPASYKKKVILPKLT